jgi:hypothetical protein
MHIGVVKLQTIIQHSFKHCLIIITKNFNIVILKYNNYAIYMISWISSN